MYTLKKSVKIAHNMLYNLMEFFRIYFLEAFYQYFEFYTSLHCVLELTETSVKVMDNVVCNELPEPFLLFHRFGFYSVVPTQINKVNFSFTNLKGIN